MTENEAEQHLPPGYRVVRGAEWEYDRQHRTGWPRGGWERNIEGAWKAIAVDAAATGQARFEPPVDPDSREQENRQFGDAEVAATYKRPGIDDAGRHPDLRRL